jgi:hypothetical protein
VLRCGSIKKAVQAYRFAHEMQITCALKSLDRMFERDVTASDIFLVYDLYKLVDDETGLAHCREVNAFLFFG